MKPAICLETIYPGLDAAYKINKIAEYDFHYVEFWDWRNKDILNIISACLENESRVVNFNGHRKGSLVAAETHHLILDELKHAVSFASQIDCDQLILLTNELDEQGAVKDAYDHLHPEEKYLNVRRGLEKIVAAIPPNINLVLEPLNTEIDHPGYYLTDMSTAIALIKDVHHPRLKVLCDLYHLGVMGYDIETIIMEHVEEIGHIHIADFPGRHEPGTGTADWVAILKFLKDYKYKGYVGFEYYPLRDSDESLHTIRALWDSVMA